MQTQTIEPGDTLLGRYEIEKRIGEGGFGVVYKARQISTGQTVAIKMLLSERMLDKKAFEEEVGRFKREMTLIARFSHPNVVRLIDSGVEGERMVMVLEFIDGRELNDILKDHGPMEPKVARRVISQTLDALNEAHTKGIIHRDLKPQNLMLTGTAPRYNVKILDFGIAGVTEDKQHEVSDDYQALTQAGQIRGTPSYMSPEQIRFGDTGAHSDLYAVGLILLECLTGQRAITGDGLQDICIKQVLEPVPIPDDLRRSPFGPVILKACEKSLDARYKSAGEMLTDLESLDLAGVIRLDTGKLAADPSLGNQTSDLRTGITAHSVAQPGLHSGQFTQSQSFPPMPATGGGGKLTLVLAFALVALLAGGGAAFYFVTQNQSTEAAHTVSEAERKAAEAEAAREAERKAAEAEAARLAAEADNARLAAEAEAARNAANPLLAFPVRARRELPKITAAAVNSIVFGSTGGELTVHNIWTITSEPQARVLDGNRVLCQITPCQLLRPRLGEQERLTLLAEGHEKTELALEGNGGPLFAVLEKERRSSSRGGSSRGGSSRGGSSRGGSDSGSNQDGDGSSGTDNRIPSFDDRIPSFD